MPYVAYPAGTPQLSVLKIVIPSDAALKRHLCDVPNAAYVAAGLLTVERPGMGCIDPSRPERFCLKWSNPCIAGLQALMGRR